ncbi:MAG TPA: hypothetical protein VJM32_04580 [Candidatus Saccharimonadales bacterium]|nr:hypothetical protein [Candidatus Saccharimonadales bacterium]
MDTYTQFIFESYELDTASHEIRLHYSLDGSTKFTETLPLPADLPLGRANDPDVKRALFALHLAGGASYYKTYLPREIVVKSGQLSQKQADFWNEFYTKGLGEFFFINKIDFHGLVKFPATGPDAPLATTTPSLPVKTLVPFGGGKDSVVTMELLLDNNVNMTLFRLRGHHYIDQLADITKLPMITVERSLDPTLFEMNKQGALNGHVPITGYITFLSIVICLLGDFDSVAFSNERSADYGNVEYLGMQINHQWSKSDEAEGLITDYLASYVTTNVQYLNPLRPLSELKIAQIFARHPKYFAHTTSCNQNWLMLDKNPGQGAWCGKCYKCAFIFALYAAELPNDTVVTMYGQNLFNNKELLTTYRQLWGAEGMKPFDCVGTPEEMKAAMYQATKKPAFANTVIGQDFITNVWHTMQDPEKLIQEALKPDFTGVSHTIRELLQGAI